MAKTLKQLSDQRERLISCGNMRAITQGGLRKRFGQ